MSSTRSTASSLRNKAIVRYNTGESSESSVSAGPSGKRKKNGSDANDSLTDDNIQRIVSDCVKYLIISDKGLPIKRLDIMKAAAKQSLDRKTIEQIMKEVTAVLLSTFGIALVECPETSGGLAYFLVNKLPVENLSQAVSDQMIARRQLFQSSILSAVLSVIFMNGGTIHEEEVWKFLTRLRLDVSPKSKRLISTDDSNGVTLRKLVCEVWVRQLYLKYSKIEKSDPLAHEFQWGLRAEKEFTKMDILKFVCRMFNDGSEPHHWRPQYEIALQEMQSNDQNDVEVME